jgi:hypothetical protein
MGKGVRRTSSSIVRHSFVVRIWREEGQAEWRGWVQHAPTGESIYVQGLEDLLGFIERRTGELAARSEQDRQC